MASNGIFMWPGRGASTVWRMSVSSSVARVGVERAEAGVVELDFADFYGLGARFVRGTGGSFT